MIDERQLIISTFSADDIALHRDELAALLHACVHDGASIGFVLPFSIADAEAFWIGKVLPRMHSGGLMLLAAWRNGRIAGSVQLDYDTPPNQPHRAEVRKLLVRMSAARELRRPWWPRLSSRRVNWAAACLPWIRGRAIARSRSMRLWDIRLPALSLDIAAIRSRIASTRQH